ncbi:hypothetical protein [Phenylobacterium koreense]|uniref:Uncharacterized protein n=1 Tax=Phenylobacterium koreense TaxID=266125 RepID=A0ABV2EGV8_9CAUL
MSSNPFDQFDEEPAAPAKRPSSHAREARAANPFDQFDEPEVESEGGISERIAKRRNMNPPLRRIDAGVRGAADMMTAGFADELSGVVGGLPALMPGGETYGEARDRIIEEERAIDDLDRLDVPWSRRAGQVAGFGAGLALGPVVNLGRVAAGVPNALRAIGAGATYGALGAAGNAEGTAMERLPEAGIGALVGGAVGAAAIPVAAAAGRGVNTLRTRFAQPIERAASALRGRTNMNQLRGRLAELREAGADPSFVNVTDESGRGFVRAAASRMTPARETVQRRAEASALDLPDRMGQQARRVISEDPRTPAQIAEATTRGRTLQGNQQFGAVRNDRVALTEDAVMALRSEDGRAAIRDAAAASLRSLDPAEREVGAELNRLAGEVLDNPGGVEISVGMAQSISEALFDAADAASRAGRNRMARSLGDMARAVRSNAADNVPGYRQALDDFGLESRRLEAAERGEDFLARNTDEFVADIPGPGQPGNDLARATARRAIERASGENPSAAPGVARKLADAPEQRMRNRALLGPEDAERLERAMAAEARVTRDMADVAPRTGSQTQLRTQDAENVGRLAGAVQTAAGGRRAIVGAIFNRLKTAGLNDADAQAVADLSTDPRMLDALLERIEAQSGPDTANWLLQIINQGGARTAGERTVPRRGVEAYIEGRPEAYDVLN